MAALQTGWRAGTLSHDIAVSCARWMLGWVPGAIVGISVGLITGRVKAIRSLLEPSRLLLRALPFIGLVPIVTSLFGTSEIGKRVLIWWISCSVCWPIVDAAAAAVPRTIIWRAATLGARPADRGKLIWGHCEASIYSALRTSLSLAWILVALVEMVGVYQRSAGTFWSEGLGYRLFRSQEEGQDGLLIGVLFIFALIGGIAELLLRGVWISIQQISLRFRKSRITKHINMLAQNISKQSGQWERAGELVVQTLAADYRGNEVFSHCSFVVDPGETLSVLGKSGSGKTTLLRALAGLYGEDLHIEGTVLLDRLPVKVDQRIGLVFQDALVFPHMTVWENVQFGRRARLNPAYGYDLLIDFGISSLATQLADTLSGGQRQRLALACALANLPQVLLLDEPFGALDAITRSQLQEQFIRNIRGHVTCIFVTHDIAESVEVASDRVMVGIGAQARFVHIPTVSTLPDRRMLREEYIDLHKKLYDTLADQDDSEAGDSVAHRVGRTPAASNRTC